MRPRLVRRANGRAPSPTAWCRRSSADPTRHVRCWPTIRISAARRSGGRPAPMSLRPRTASTWPAVTTPTHYPTAARSYRQTAWSRNSRTPESRSPDPTNRRRSLGSEAPPVALGDDLDSAVDHLDRGRVVDRVRRPRNVVGPPPSPRHGVERHLLVIEVREDREVDHAQGPVVAA